MLTFLLLMLTLLGCTLTSASPVDLTAQAVPPTPTTVTTIRTTPVATLARVVQSVDAMRPTALITEQASPTPVSDCNFADSTPTTRHEINATLDYPAQTVLVDQTVTYINRTPNTLNDFVLNVEPNRLPDAFTLYSLAEMTEAGSQTPAFDLTGRRLAVTLTEPLKIGCALTLRLSFLVKVPPVGGGSEAYRGFFAHSDRQLNLGHWLPTVALRVNEEWITRQAVFLGEQEVLPVADWDVTLTIKGASDTVKVAAPGDVTELGKHEWRYVFPAARDFTVSISEAFELHEIVSEDGVTLELYSFPESNAVNGDPLANATDFALNIGVRALEEYSDLYGMYPYKRLLVVQGDFPDGMEFSGIVFVSGTWFKGYTGDPAGYLLLITVHEIAHQWWYAQVGNDPAVAPWLDESLATYSEYAFIEEFYPNLKDWWWQFRVDNYAPQGYVDSTVYEFNSIRAYINAIYLRGVKMLHALREDIGTEAFYDWLKRYATTGRGEVVTPDFFWSLLSPEQLTATEATRLEYLRSPQVGG